MNQADKIKELDSRINELEKSGDYFKGALKLASILGIAGAFVINTLWTKKAALERDLAAIESSIHTTVSNAVSGATATIHAVQLSRIKEFEGAAEAAGKELLEKVAVNMTENRDSGSLQLGDVLFCWGKTNVPVSVIADTNSPDRPFTVNLDFAQQFEQPPTISATTQVPAASRSPEGKREVFSIFAIQSSEKAVSIKSMATFKDKPLPNMATVSFIAVGRSAKNRELVKKVAVAF